MNTKHKPIVNYTPQDADYIRVGHRAFVQPINHPSLAVSNTTGVMTSPFVKITEDGFETQNTIYRKEKSCC